MRWNGKQIFDRGTELRCALLLEIFLFGIGIFHLDDINIQSEVDMQLYHEMVAAWVHFLLTPSWLEQFFKPPTANCKRPKSVWVCASSGPRRQPWTSKAKSNYNCRINDWMSETLQSTKATSKLLWCFASQKKFFEPICKTYWLLEINP